MEKHAMKILVIQTAFIGDVILATPIIEKLKKKFPNSQIDFLLRKGNEILLQNNPNINETLIWEKKKNKFKNFFKLIFQIRKNNYNYVVNVHRFFSSGILTVFSKAEFKIGFDKNPISFLFSKSVKHKIEFGKHEIHRNIDLIGEITDFEFVKPKLYFSEDDSKKISTYKKENFVCIFPSSVWFTKQLPKNKWIELCNKIPNQFTVYILGSLNDKNLGNEIILSSSNKNIVNLCGKFSLLQSALFMTFAKMNFVNDSAPLHFASATNSPVVAFFCSTVFEFGFFPLSEKNKIVEVKNLNCKPCGIHGFKNCPQKHFDCGNKIDIDETIKFFEMNL